MWPADFTYFKIICWGWVYLSTVLDNFCATSSSGSFAPQCGEDVTDTLDMALAAPGRAQVSVHHKP